MRPTGAQSGEGLHLGGAEDRQCAKVPFDSFTITKVVGFDVDFRSGKFQVLPDRGAALNALVDSILAAKHGRVQARRLASVAGTVLSMHLPWGPVA